MQLGFGESSIQRMMPEPAGVPLNHSGLGRFRAEIILSLVKCRPCTESLSLSRDLMTKGARVRAYLSHVSLPSERVVKSSISTYKRP